MTTFKKKLGQYGEELAAQFLLLKGYRIIAKNLTIRYGEIDILAVDGSELVVVEVKTKADRQYGSPADLIGRRKLEKLQRLSQAIAKQYNMVEYRVDAITIDLSHQPPTIDHLKAIEL